MGHKSDDGNFYLINDRVDYSETLSSPVSEADGTKVVIRGVIAGEMLD